MMSGGQCPLDDGTGLESLQGDHRHQLLLSIPWYRINAAVHAEQLGGPLIIQVWPTLDIHQGVVQPVVPEVRHQNRYDRGQGQRENHLGVSCHLNQHHREKQCNSPSTSHERPRAHNRSDTRIVQPRKTEKLVGRDNLKQWKEAEPPLVLPGRVGMGQRQAGLHLHHQHSHNSPDHPPHNHHREHQPRGNHRPRSHRGQDEIHGEEHQHGPQWHDERGTPCKNISDRIFRRDQRQRRHGVEKSFSVVVQVLAVQRHFRGSRGGPSLRVQEQGATHVGHRLAMPIILAGSVEMPIGKRLLAVKPTAVIPVR
mmetsp:Transcript_42979/g.112971  ORF Transcript_42979/g.112971 Transcript_42979/m.112971 type:complete len:310 (-) Transcript_42979:1556-2485(-)